MIYSIDGNIVTLGGAFLERKVNTLTFQTSGTQFPMGTSQPTYKLQYVNIWSNREQSFTINYGDGTIQSYLLKPYQGRFEFKMTFDDNTDAGGPVSIYYPKHIYTDGFSGVRNITMTFQNLEWLDTIRFNYVRLEGNFPIEINYAAELRDLNLNNTLNLNELPDSIIENRNLRNINFSNAFNVIQTEIPVGLFSIDLEMFIASSTYDLSDVISSNFYRIDSWRDSITNLELNSSNITDIPEELSTLTKLTRLGLRENPIVKIPPISNMVNLSNLEFGRADTPFDDTRWGDMSNLHKLSIMSIRTPNMDLSTLEVDWKNLYSLNNINLFNSLVINNTRFDEFIDSFYNLVTQNGSITQNSGEFVEYPNRFRNISWGHGTLSFTGAKVAPQGYVQGVSNGTPANQGEKVYVLQNQYGHTITHA